MPESSFVMPARNAEAYIETALESIKMQSISDWEVVLVDDGSTDRTTSIAESIIGRKLRVVSNIQTLGVAASLNRALETSSSRFIIRLDADDIATPKRLESQLQVAKSRNAGLVAGWFRYIGPRGQTLATPRLSGAVDNHDIHWALAVGNPICHPAVLIDRNRINVRYDETQPIEDYALWLDLASQQASMVVDQTVATYWRLHRRNQSKVAVATGTQRLATRLAAHLEEIGVASAIPLSVVEQLLQPTAQISIDDIRLLSKIQADVLAAVKSDAARRLVIEQSAVWSHRVAAACARRAVEAYRSTPAGIWSLVRSASASALRRAQLVRQQ